MTVANKIYSFPLCPEYIIDKNDSEEEDIQYLNSKQSMIDYDLYSQN